MATSNANTNHVVPSKHDPAEGLPLAGYQGAKMAMWLFLATEILLFAGLFAVYVYFRSLEPDNFLAGSKKLDVIMGGVNTVFLLCSSLTIALALDAVQRGNAAKMKKLLWTTLGFGVAFLIVKYFEYSHKAHLGYFPGMENFHEFGRFLPLYFMMTALHGIHVLVGMGCMIGVLWFARKDAYSEEYYVPVENTALYWHLVDIIWIFLFPLMYLI